jgi:hypothetical protein
MLKAFKTYSEEVNNPEGNPGARDNQEERGVVLNDEKAHLVLKRENAEREMVTR